MSKHKSFTLDELAKATDSEIVGDPNLTISRLDTLDSASNGSITFLAKSKYKKLLDKTDASAVIVKDGTPLGISPILINAPSPNINIDIGVTINKAKRGAGIH